MNLQTLTRHQNAGHVTRALTLCKCTSASPPSRRTPQQRRHAHVVPRLGRHQQLFEEKGIPELYTQDGFKISWTDRMGHTINRLNDVLAHGPGDLANSSPKDISLQTARSPSNAHLFNWASMAHNTHFYFSSLSPRSVDIPKELQEPISRSFSSVDTLKDTMLTTAEAMFGPGFVWLCQVNDIPLNHPNAPREDAAIPVPGGRTTVGGRSIQGRTQMTRPLDLRLLTTYLAGSPYPGAHARQQNKDLNTENLASMTDHYRQSTAQNSVGSFGAHAKHAMGSIGGDGTDHKRYGGADVVPLLCVNTWEHAWLHDWGCGGKRWFLEKWWNRIDWDVVLSRVEWQAPSSRRLGPSFGP